MPLMVNREYGKSAELLTCQIFEIITLLALYTQTMRQLDEENDRWMQLSEELEALTK